MNHVFRALCVSAILLLSGPALAQDLTSEQRQAIKDALQRVVISNNLVESAIYDGMTYNEVLKILGMVDLFIGAWDRHEGGSDLSVYTSRVGKYVIYWSGGVGTNPIVIGYARDEHSPLMHNKIQ